MNRFIALLFSLSLFSCAGPAALIVAPQANFPAKSDRIKQSAEQRGVSVDDMIAADNAITSLTPKPTLWENPQVRGQAATQWATLCASCHGARGRQENTPRFNPAPRTFGGFGMAMGFTMGGDKMRGKIFERIQNGKGAMPGFANQLTNREIWALVYFIEHL